MEPESGFQSLPPNWTLSSPARRREEDRNDGEGRKAEDFRAIADAMMKVWKSIVEKKLLVMEM